MSKETGGPAFPIVAERGPRIESAEGMTLRDYFAAKAMNAIAPLAFKKVDGDGYGLTPAGIEMAKDIAAVVYCIADAMLAERSK